MDAPWCMRATVVAGAERTMSKHRAFFCSTFVHVSGSRRKKGPAEADPFGYWHCRTGLTSQSWRRIRNLVLHTGRHIRTHLRPTTAHTSRSPPTGRDLHIWRMYMLVKSTVCSFAVRHVASTGFLITVLIILTMRTRRLHVRSHLHDSIFWWSQLTNGPAARQRSKRSSVPLPYWLPQSAGWRET